LFFCEKPPIHRGSPLCESPSTSLLPDWVNPCFFFSLAALVPRDWQGMKSHVVWLPNCDRQTIELKCAQNSHRLLSLPGDPMPFFPPSQFVPTSFFFFPKSEPRLSISSWNFSSPKTLFPAQRTDSLPFSRQDFFYPCPSLMRVKWAFFPLLPNSHTYLLPLPLKMAFLELARFAFAALWGKVLVFGTATRPTWLFGLTSAFLPDSPHTLLVGWSRFIPGHSLFHPDCPPPFLVPTGFFYWVFLEKLPEPAEYDIIAGVGLSHDFPCTKASCRRNSRIFFHSFVWGEGGEWRFFFSLRTFCLSFFFSHLSPWDPCSARASVVLVVIDPFCPLYTPFPRFVSNPPV